MDNQKFGKFIKELRKKSNMTQKELGEKLNVTDKAVSKWERGLSFPDITIINSLAETFGITSSEILNAELGKKEEIDIEKAVQEAVENIMKEKEKRQEKRKKIQKIITIISTVLFDYLIFVKTFFINLLYYFFVWQTSENDIFFKKLYLFHFFYDKIQLLLIF